MQSLTAAPRQSLNSSVVQALLSTTQIVRVDCGVDLLDQQLNVVSDLTNYMSPGSTVSRDNYATVHGTCDLKMDSNTPFTSNQLLRPWQSLTDPDTGNTAKFYMGVYVPTSPDHDNSVNPSVMDVTGYDLLYKLNQPIGDSVQVLIGSDPIGSAISLLGDALPTMTPTVDYEDTSYTLSSDIIFPFDSQNNGTTWLTAINTLLTTAGYRGLWVDWTGTFQMHKYVSPSQLVPEWLFDLNNTASTIVQSQRSSHQDTFDVPNRWIFIMNNTQNAPVEGTTQYTYVDTDPVRATSYINRGWYSTKVQFVSAATYAALVALAQITIDSDLNPSETFNIATSPFPLAWHFDQSRIIDPNLATVSPLYSDRRRLQCRSWQQDLYGADTTWTWEAISG